jgi:hypothetical protein
MRGLHIAADLQAGLADSAAQQAGQEPAQQAFISAHGAGFTVSQAHAPALQALLRAPGLPLWQSADALLDAYPASADLLHECVLRGLLNAWREPPDMSDLQPMQMPSWLRKEAVRSASVYLPSIWHQPVGLSQAERQLIAQLDGRFMPDAALSQASIERFVQLGWLRA